MFDLRKSGWGRFTCRFCNQKVVAYNDKRHSDSKKHKDNVEAYEKKNRVVVIENIDKLSPRELQRILKEKLDG